MALLLFSVKHPDFNTNYWIVFWHIGHLTTSLCVIIYTKWDLLNEEEAKAMQKICEYYQSIGYPYLAYSTKAPSPHTIEDIKVVIKGKISVITGKAYWQKQFNQLLVPT